MTTLPAHMSRNRVIRNIATHTNPCIRPGTPLAVPGVVIALAAMRSAIYVLLYYVQTVFATPLAAAFVVNRI